MVELAPYSHYVGFLDRPDRSVLPMEVELLTEREYDLVATHQHTIAIPTEYGNLPAFVPFDSMGWNNTEYMRAAVRSVGQDPNIPCVIATSALLECTPNYQPNPKDIAHAVGRLPSKVLVVCDWVTNSAPDQPAALVLPPESVHGQNDTLDVPDVLLAALTDNGIVTTVMDGRLQDDPVFHTNYTSDIELPPTEQPRNDHFRSLSDHLKACHEQEIVSKTDFPDTLDGQDFEDVWQIYEREFAKLAKIDPITPGFSKEACLDLLNDPDTIMSIARSTSGENIGRIVAICLLRDVRLCDWLNQALPKSLYLKQYNRGLVWHSIGVVANAGSVGAGIKTMAQFRPFFAGIQAGQETPILTFMCDQASDQSVPGLCTRALNKGGLKVAGLGYFTDKNTFVARPIQTRSFAAWLVQRTAA